VRAVKGEGTSPHPAYRLGNSEGGAGAGTGHHHTWHHHTAKLLTCIAIQVSSLANSLQSLSSMTTPGIQVREGCMEGAVREGHTRGGNLFQLVFNIEYFHIVILLNIIE